MSDESNTPAADVLEREGDIAADYLEGLLDIADLDGDIDIDVAGDRAHVSIVEAVPGDLADLVGDDGEVLDALQGLARLAATRDTGGRSRLMLDIAGFRINHRERLTATATDAVEAVRATGQPVALRAMTAYERKVVHDVIAEAGLVSESEGEDPHRHVVVRPA